MNASRLSLGLFSLAVAALWYVGGGTAVPAQSPSPEGEQTVSAPATHDNLTAFFILGPDTVSTAKVVTLQEAMEAGWAKIEETGNVNTLTVENRSPDSELFIQDGDIIRGGKQDRMIARDMLLPPQSGKVPFHCHCVESGRWTGRGKEAATHFSRSDNFAVGQSLRCANVNMQQPAVWSSVEDVQKKLAKATNAQVASPESATSLELTLESPIVKERVAAYESALKELGESRGNVVGVAFAVNGEVTSYEIYGSHALFCKAWPKLLRSAAIEALAEKGARPTLRVPTAGEFERYLACEARGDFDAKPNTLAQASLSTRNQPFCAVPVPEHPENNLANLRQAPIEFERIAQDNRGIASITLSRGEPQTGGNRNRPSASPNYSGSVASTPLSEVAVPRPTPAPGTANRHHDNVLVQPTDEENVFAVRSGSTRTIILGNNSSPEALNNFGHPGLPALQTANRLNVNLSENASGYVSESRDASRQNAVIHRSFVKQAQPGNSNAPRNANPDNIIR